MSQLMSLQGKRKQRDRREEGLTVALTELVRENAHQEAEALNSLVPLLATQTDQTNKATDKCKTNTTRLLAEWWNQV